MPPAPEFRQARCLRACQPRRRHAHRAREHRPTGLVEIAGADREDVHQPGGERPEFLRAQADPAINRGAGHRGELARGASGRRCGDPGECLDGFRRKGSDDVAHDVDTVDEICHCPEVDKILREQHMQNGEQPGGKAPVPGWMPIHSSACRAVPVRRGSTTTTRPPRARTRSISPTKSGSAIRLPFDADGFAPRHRK